MFSRFGRTIKMIITKVTALCFCTVVFIVQASDSPLGEKYSAKSSDLATSEQYSNTSSGTFGCDVSSLVEPATFQCLRKAGIEFVIIRAYRSTCKF